MPSRKSPPPDVAALFESLDPKVRTLAEKARTLVLATLPGAIELPDPKDRLIGYGYGPGYKDVVATLILSKQGVKLGLVGGTELPLGPRSRAHEEGAARPLIWGEPL